MNELSQCIDWYNLGVWIGAGLLVAGVLIGKGISYFWIGKRKQ